MFPKRSPGGSQIGSRRRLELKMAKPRFSKTVYRILMIFEVPGHHFVTRIGSEIGSESHLRRGTTQDAVLAAQDAVLAAQLAARDASWHSPGPSPGSPGSIPGSPGEPWAGRLGPRKGLRGAGRCWEVLGGAGERWDALRHASPLLSDSPPPTSLLRSNEPHLPHADDPTGTVGRRIRIAQV